MLCFGKGAQGDTAFVLDDAGVGECTLLQVHTVDGQNIAQVEVSRDSGVVPVAHKKPTT